MHSSGDTLFPLSDGFGRQAADWWASCMGCFASPDPPEANGCVVYPECAGGVEVRYCEGTTPHGFFPTELNDSIFSFFDRFRRG